MKKLFITVVTCTGIVLALLFGLYKSNVFFLGQKINNISVQFQSYTNATDMVKRTYKRTVYVNYADNEYTFTDITVELSPIPHLSFTDWLCHKPITLDVTYSLGDSARAFLSELYESYVDADIAFEDGRWVLTQEVVGCDFDIDEVLLELQKLPDVVNLDSFCVKPTVTATSLQSKWAKLKWMNDFRFSYTNGYTIDAASLYDYVDTGVLRISLEDCTDIVKEISTDYCTKNLSLSLFSTYINDDINISYKTFGKEVDVKKEAQYLYDSILSHSSEIGRTPYTTGYDDFGDTYVEISIEGQHCWYYKDGQLAMDTPIVTGTKNRHDTPTGVFYITECIPGKYLVGDTYKTWVDRWMRLTNTGIGLHGAGWRSSFGKSIYTYNGSHGCINLPKAWAYDFYKEAYVGMPVVIY